MSSTDKHRFFDFLVYPESAPKDWCKQLKDTHAMFSWGPLHKADEENDKPHHHAMFYSGRGPITLKAAKKVIPDGIAANCYVEPTKSPAGYMRYLIHLDDPQKEQFPGGANEITCVNGFPLDLTRELSKSEKAKIRNDLLDYINDNSIVEYAELIYSLFGYGNPDWLDYAFNHTIAFNAILKSIRHGKVQ